MIRAETLWAAQVTSGAVTVGRQKLFHQHVLNSSPLKMQINSGSPTTSICSESLLTADSPIRTYPRPLESVTRTKPILQYNDSHFRPFSASLRLCRGTYHIPCPQATMPFHSFLLKPLKWTQQSA